MERIYGTNRLDTAVQIARKFWPHPDTVLLARADVSADALASGVLDIGPVLLVNASGQGNEAVLDYVREKHPGTIVALGGNGAVPEAILSSIAGEVGARSERLAGANRMETSLAIAQSAYPDECPASLYLAGAFGRDGQGSPDALASGTLFDPTLLIHETNGPTPAQQAYINKCGAAGTSVTNLGSLQVPGAYESITGKNRYQTAAFLFSQPSSLLKDPLFPQYQPKPALLQRLNRHREAALERRVVVARGDVFADAIVAGSIPMTAMLLTTGNELHRNSGWYHLTRTGQHIYLLGGEKALSNNVFEDVQQALTDDNWLPRSARPTITDPNQCPSTGSSYENGLDPIAQRALRCIWRDLGPITVISGKRGTPGVDSGEHPLGLAIDLSVTDGGIHWSDQRAINRGEQIAEYLNRNGELLGVSYILFRDMMYEGIDFKVEHKPYQGPFNPTAQHYDHVHVSFFGPEQYE